MNYTTEYVSPDHIESVWNVAKLLLRKPVGMSNGRWGLDNVFAGLIRADQQLWFVYDDEDRVVAALTTQIMCYPGKRMAAIHFIGGRGFADWYPNALETITRYAKDYGCDGIECNARHGFWKWFQKDGWVRPSAWYEKSI
jgi:hypothetical protein